MNKLIREARKFATFHHADVNQRRKYTNEPYIVHPAAVAKLVSTVPHSPAMIAAAWLHDVAEDTNATIEDIYKNFGNVVGTFVAGLTDVAKPNDGNRAARMTINNEHTDRQCIAVKTIKLADSYCNVKDIMRQDPKFAITYMEEKRKLILCLRQGNPTLYKMLSDLLRTNV
jgi:(p)ppGpp synthase/HD superfamily hydrolase